MKIIIKIIWMAAVFIDAFGIIECRSQDTATTKTLTASGYAEIYYIYDFNRPVDHTRPGFVYSHNRTNEVNISLVFLKANYVANRVRMNVVLATGTYMNGNYASEPGVLKNIYEADAGVKISKKHDLWIDAGVMPSHIGFESAIGKDNVTVTRSLAAENSPYFETGVKMGYTSANKKWYLALLYLNGWQRIQRIDGNTTACFGSQVTYTPSSKFTLNYSTFAGNDFPDSLRRMRYFHDLYGIITLSDQFGITAGFDLGMQQKEKGSNDFDTWYTPVIIARYQPSSKINVGMRAEYFNDKNGVIISTGTLNGFKTVGLSANLDYYILPEAVWRIEIRNFNSKDDIFVKQRPGLVNNSTSLTMALAISF